ncbi:uncharacterized protein LOC118646944, partial [Monomorium pharaonis]|uniref:uncharacterized protein LOC118646944 n=1 Tax=Monomorium pharaonis TaxID=307658 RepID=UPI001745FD29
KKKGGIAIEDLNDEFEILVGESIPYCRLGFASLRALLRTIDGLEITWNNFGLITTYRDLLLSTIKTYYYYFESCCDFLLGSVDVYSNATCDEMIRDMTELLQVLRSKFHLSNTAITICTFSPLANLGIHVYKTQNLALFSFNN